MSPNAYCLLLSSVSLAAYLAGVQPAFAQEKAEMPAAAPLPVGKPLDRTHHLGPGDIIEINVSGIPEFSRPVRLFADGTFDYPIMGTVSAAGLTVQELAQRVTEGMKKELRRPLVTVVLKEIYVPPPPPKVEKVIPKIVILGAALKKGEVELPEPKPLRTLLAEIGPTEKADLSKIRIRYPDGSARTADFSQFNRTGKAEEDVLVSGGEEIVLLELPPVLKPDPVRVELLGAVSKPGTYELEAGATILELIQKAGGPTESAELADVEVNGPKHGKPQKVDVESYTSGDTSDRYVVQAGDVITVPQKPLKVYAYGEVPSPGEYSFRKGQRVMDLFLKAGHPRAGGSGQLGFPAGGLGVGGGGLGSFGGGGGGGGADPSRTQIIRKGQDGKPVYFTINIREIMKGRDAKNMELQDGDILFVPNKKVRRGIFYYLSALTTPLWLMRFGTPGL